MQGWESYNCFSEQKIVARFSKVAEGFPAASGSWLTNGGPPVALAQPMRERLGDMEMQNAKHQKKQLQNAEWTFALSRK